MFVKFFGYVGTQLLADELSTHDSSQYNLIFVQKKRGVVSVSLSKFFFVLLSLCVTILKMYVWMKRTFEFMPLEGKLFFLDKFHYKCSRFNNGICKIEIVGIDDVEEISEIDF